MEEIKNILFTFDYELFLGTRSGTVNNCLLKPTSQLLELFTKYEIKHAIFFVDTTYLLRLKEQKNLTCQNEYNLIKNQLTCLIKKGHYVFPHLHPHWFDAIYHKETNQWSLKNYSKYRFSHITIDQREILFNDSIKLLKEIIDPVNAEYKINGYRAGGWSLQPFSDFKPFFLKYGIKYDFSVLKGFKNLSDAQYFDFRNCPDNMIYKFEDDPCVKSENGSFIEYAISSVKITNTGYWLSKFWGKYLWKTGQRSIGDGSGLFIKESDEAGKKDTGFTKKEMVSLELLTKIKLGLYKKFMRSNNYMHFISHPKMLSQHNIECFDKFLNFATKKYKLQTNFLELKTELFS